MWIGVGRLVLDFYNNDNLALKHREIEKLCKDIRRKYNLSMLEVADMDEFERCVIGFSAVIPDHWKESKAKSFIQNLCKDIDETSFARVTSEDWDLLSF